MHIVGVILLLVSIGTIAAPIGAVVVMYQGNLMEIVVPPQISDIMNGNSTIFNDNGGNDDNDLFGSNQQLIAPVLVDKDFDTVSRTFSVTVNFTNTLNFNLTVKQFSANIVCSEHNYPLGSIALNNVVEINTGESSLITVSGAWTQEAENHITTDHPGATAIDVNLVDVTINVNDIIIQEAAPISIGSVSLTGQ
jgi:hypothetical protein